MMFVFAFESEVMLDPDHDSAEIKDADLIFKMVYAGRSALAID